MHVVLVPTIHVDSKTIPGVWNLEGRLGPHVFDDIPLTKFVAAKLHLTGSLQDLTAREVRELLLQLLLHVMDKAPVGTTQVRGPIRLEAVGLLLIVLLIIAICFAIFARELKGWAVDMIRSFLWLCNTGSILKIFNLLIRLLRCDEQFWIEIIIITKTYVWREKQDELLLCTGCRLIQHMTHQSLAKEQIGSLLS